MKTDLIIFPIYSENALDNAELLISEMLRIRSIDTLIYIGNESIRLKVEKAQILKNYRNVKILGKERLMPYLNSQSNVNIKIFTDEYSNHPMREILQLKLNFKSKLYYYQHGLNHELTTAFHHKDGWICSKKEKGNKIKHILRSLYRLLIIMSFMKIKMYILNYQISLALNIIRFGFNARSACDVYYCQNKRYYSRLAIDDKKQVVFVPPLEVLRFRRRAQLAKQSIGIDTKKPKIIVYSPGVFRYGYHINKFCHFIDTLMSTYPDFCCILKVKPGEMKSAKELFAQSSLIITEDDIPLEILEKSIVLLPEDSALTCEFYCSDIYFNCFKLYPNPGFTAQIIAKSNGFVVEIIDENKDTVLPSIVDGRFDRPTIVIEDWEQYRLEIIKQTYNPTRSIVNVLCS